MNNDINEKDIKIRRAVARIQTLDEQGTGFCIASNLVITACHVVLADDENSAGIGTKTTEESKIAVNFPYYRPEKAFSVKKIILDESENNLDIALLLLEENLEEGIALDIKYGSIPLDTQWKTFGYPQLKKPDCLRLKGEVGNIDEKNLIWDVELKIQSEYDTLARYIGLSGSPLVIENTVIGVIVEASNKTLYAINLEKAYSFIENFYKGLSCIKKPVIKKIVEKKEIDISYGEELKKVESPESVTSVFMKQAEFNEEDLVSLKKMPNLEKINLSSTLLTNKGLSHLKEIDSLVLLYLGQTNINDDGLVHLQSLNQLETLELTNTEITDKGLKYICKLESLKHLDIAETKVTNDSIDYLIQLKNLKKLNAHCTNITHSGLRKLQRKLKCKIDPIPISMVSLQRDLDELRLDQKLETSISQLHNRYTPIHHTSVDSENYLEAFSHGKEFYEKLSNIVKELVSSCENLIIDTKALQKTNAIQDVQSKWKKHESLFKDKKNLKVDKISDLQISCRDIDIIVIETIRIVSGYHTNYKRNHNSLVSPFSKTLDSLNQCQKTLKKCITFFGKFLSIKSQFLLINGERGSGKSHLIAHLAKKLSTDQIVILCLGEQFIDTVDPWRQLIQIFGWSKTIDEILNLINEISEESGRPGLIFVDAINESSNCRMWATWLPMMVNKINDYSNIKLIVSCRSDYLDICVPPYILAEKSNWNYFYHEGLGSSLFKAIKKYFKAYKIQTEHFPPIFEELNNPLLLTVVCEAYEGETLPKSSIVLSDIMKHWIRKASQKIRITHNYPTSIIEKAVNLITKKMTSKGTKTLNICNIRDDLDDLFEVREESKSLYNILRTNGIFIEIKNYKNQIQIKFPFDKISDYFIAKHILSDSKSVKTLKREFLPSGKLYHLLKQDKGSQHNAGIAEAISILVPENFHVEISDIVPKNLKDQTLTLFVKSIRWRSFDSFTSKSKKLLLQSLDKHLEITLLNLIRVAIIPEHPYNAKFLHGWLYKLSLIQRDTTWTMAINNLIDNQVINRIFEWAQTIDSAKISNEQAELGATVICWFFGSTCWTFRDKSTRITIKLLHNRPEACLNILQKFSNVNDPYVLERVYAVFVGLVMRSQNKKFIKNVSEIVYQKMFTQKEVYPHILIRDYAQTVLEIALHHDILPKKINTDQFRPTYKSQWPKKIWSENYVNSLEEKQKYYILMGSLRLEKMRNYGDFGRYIMESALHDFQSVIIEKEKVSTWKKLWDILCFSKKDTKNQEESINKKESYFDTTLARRWIIQRIHELGWCPKYSKIDKTTHARHYRDRPYIERLSKKYQWIGLYEFLGLVADHYKMRSDWGNIPRKYEGSWQLSIRDFDPSILMEDIKTEKEKTQNWWNQYPKLIHNIQNKKDWTLDTEIPSFQIFINIKGDNDQTQYATLCGYYTWNEHVPKYESYKELPRCRFWAHVRSWLIKKSDREKLLKHLQNKQLWGHGIDIPHISSGWLGEYPFASSYKIYDDNNINTWLEDTDIQSTLTTLQYYNENVDPIVSRYIPSLRMCNLLEMHWSGSKFDFVNMDNKIVCFSPELCKEDDVCIVDFEMLKLKLRQNDMDIVWGVVGEKSLSALKETDGVTAETYFSAVYYINKGKIEGDFTRIDTRDYEKRKIALEKLNDYPDKIKDFFINCLNHQEPSIKAMFNAAVDDAEKFHEVVKMLTKIIPD